MLDTTRSEAIAISASQNAVNALIETQVILQLLVKKGIVTPEEVAVTREIVSRQPRYKQLIESLDIAMDNVNESAKIENLLHKASQPGGRDKLTKEEKDYLLDYLRTIGQ